MIRLAIVLICALAFPVYAQQIGIRSGAHADFSRLVLDVTPGTDWRVEQIPNGTRLTVDEHLAGFDTSAVFDRIDRSFISSVSADTSSINIQFSCACKATVYNAGSGMIVVDVSADETVQPPDERATSALSFVGQRPLRFDDGQIVTEARSEPIQDNILAPSASPQRIAGTDDNLNVLLQVEAVEAVDAERLRELRTQIAEQVSSAATRGILTPSGTDADLPVLLSKPQINTSVFELSPKPDPQITGDRSANNNIRITSSSDVPDDMRRRLSSSISDGLHCLDPQSASIQDWGKEDAVSQQISELRGRLYGEFDELDHEVALQLARTYLYFGFGAEARQTIMLHRDIQAQHPGLVAMADVLEFGHSPDSQYLSRFLECDSDIALWAILSSETIEPSRSVNINAALRGVSALPMHLRNILAPELSKRLLSYGDADAASAALRSLERATANLAPNANLAKAGLELAQQDTTEAQARLAQVVTSNTEQSAKALIKFVDSHLAEDAEIDEDIATLVEAYALEMRDDPIEAELRRTHVLALGKSGQFSEAFDALARMRARSAEKTADPIRSAVLDLLIRQADDVEFLEHAFTQIGISPETLLPEVRLELGQRLTDLGFPEQAELVLQSGDNEPDSPSIALLSARISLELDRPLQALAHLFGQESEEAALLRATAEAKTGDFSSAHSIFSQLGSTIQARNSAWLSQDWSMRVEETTPVFGAMVSVAQTTLDDKPERDGMLERSATAISESQSARSAIQALLNSEELRLPELE